MQRDREGGAATAAAQRTDPRRLVIRTLVLAAAVGTCLLADLTASQPAHAHAAGTVHAAVSAAVPAAPVPAEIKPGEELTDADKDLLVKVRLAGLWEMPAGQMAAEKGSNARVRQVGQMISSQHKELDALVVKAARQVGVELPNQPNSDQQRWLGELTAASGAQFDQVFVDRLRAAHGKVFPAIANVRAGTRNPVVRELAQRANGFVMTHMTLLESTGLVDYSTLPPPPQPSPTPATAATTGAYGGAGSNSQAVGLASANASTGTSFLSAPWYAGIILPIALLLIVPRLVRAAVRRRLATRAAADYEPLPRTVRYDRPSRLEPLRRDGGSRRPALPGRDDDPAGRYLTPSDGMPSPYAEPPGDPRSPRRSRTDPRVRP